MPLLYARERTATRGLALCLAAVFLLSVCLPLAACSKKTDEPAVSPLARTVATVDGWEVRYDLARGLFGLAMTETGDAADALRKTEEDLRGICAVFSLLRDGGGDPFDEQTTRLTDRLMEVDIYGGSIGETQVAGYGSIFAYLETIGAYGMTYEAAHLLARRSVCREILIEHAEIAARDADGEEMRQTVEAFFQSEECLHFSWVYTEKTFVPETDARLLRYMTDEVRPALTAAETHEKLLQLLSVSFNPTEEPPARRAGYYVTAATLRDGYEAVSEALKDLSPWEISPVIETEDAYCILVALPKEALTADDARYDELRDLWAENDLCRRLAQKAETLSVVWSELPEGAPER